jgi:hypothetical protein
MEHIFYICQLHAGEAHQQRARAAPGVRGGMTAAFVAASRHMSLVDEMAGQGADAPDEDLPAIVQYLAKALPAAR